jgi:hypothetical protein
MKHYDFQLDMVSVSGNTKEEAKKEALKYLKTVTEIFDSEITEYEGA